MKRGDFRSEELEEFVSLTSNGLAATYIYSRNVCAGGALAKYAPDNRAVRTVAVSGTVFVPSIFFSKFLGAAEENKDGFCVLKNGEKELSVKVGSAEYILCGEAGSFEKPLFSKEGCVYLPAAEAARLLGYAVGSYYQDRLFVAGNAAAIEKLDANERLVFAGCYAVFGDYDISEATSADYKAAKDKWRIMLVGSPEINDLSNPTFLSKIENVDKKCEKSYSTMNKDGDPIILWGDAAPVEIEELGIQYSGIRNMAFAYGTYGSKYYKDPEILAAIKFGMDWMFNHMYGEAEITNTGWRDTHAYNWWYWFVGAPEHITDIIMSIEDELSMEDKKRYLKAFEHIQTWMCTTSASRLTRVCVCTKVGLVLEEPKYLIKEAEDFDSLLELSEKGTPRIDYCDFCHGFPYNLAYGLLNLNRVLLVASMLAGSVFEYFSPEMYNQFGLCKYMFEPPIYRGQGFVMFLGRSTSGKNLSTGAAVVTNLLPMIGVFGEDEDNYVKRMIKRNSVHPELVENVKNQCSYGNLATYISILEDDSIPSDNDYEIGYAWYTGDRVAQQRNNYAVGIAMTSKREFAYESINQANQTGWYTGDGALYLYTDYDYKQYDGDNFITKNELVAYNFPGTTEDERPREARSILGGEAWRPSKAFAGGIDFEDKYVVAAMDFESEYFDGPDKCIKDTGYGTGRAVHKNDLRSKKAWFCFDDEIISMSAGINSTMDSPVNTTVEHRRIVEPELHSQKICLSNGSVVTLDKGGYYYCYTNPKWFLMEGHAGYVFLEDAKLLLNRYKCETADSQSFLRANIQHGKNPVDASYAYAIIPYATAEKLDKYHENADVEIISNTTALQAVREKNLGITGYVFHEAGSAEGIDISEAAILVVKEKDGILSMRITDPTHELKSATIVINKPLRLIDAHKKLFVGEFKDKTVITVDFKGSCGRPYGASFEIK